MVKRKLKNLEDMYDYISFFRIFIKLIRKNKLYKKELKPRRIKVSKDKIENSYIIFFIMGHKSIEIASIRVVDKQKSRC